MTLADGQDSSVTCSYFTLSFLTLSVLDFLLYPLFNQIKGTASQNKDLSTKLTLIKLETHVI